MANFDRYLLMAEGCPKRDYFSDSSAAPRAHAEILHRAAIAHERIVFQAHSTRNGLFKREPDIVGTNGAFLSHSTRSSGSRR